MRTNEISGNDSNSYESETDKDDGRSILKSKKTKIKKYQRLVLQRR